ncbi:MAG TPA: FG-GAP-like repeat-containing protein [Bacteroidia bacterium]|nr:FG-GAP-like repeat-containing protein [Bacteroidia bacterium]
MLNELQVICLQNMKAMKKINLTLVLILGCITPIFPQLGFVKVVDPTNPVTTFMSPGIYKGASWMDFDNDNDIDLFAAPNHLYRNDGGGYFAEISNPFGLSPLQNPGGSSWADLNADGLIDCIIAQFPSGVFLNNGNETFTDISSQIDSFNGFPAWGCAIGDWNKDAYPDFIFAHAAYFHAAGPFPSKLYLNSNSAVTPSYVTGYTLTDSVKPYTVPYWSDFDLDGDMDLFVASGPGGSPGPDFCYRNLKMETGLDSLERMSNTLFSTQLQDGQCYNFIDFDNDNDLDLCLTNYAGAPSRFYENANGTYTELTTPFSSQTYNLSNNWGDFDNDGDLDVLISNDQAATKFYRNAGAGQFNAPVNLGVAGGSGITNGDYDNDGDLDLFIHGATNARALFRNDTVAGTNHWVSLKCTGTVSNKSALGTIVRIKAVINGVPVWQMREINAQNAFQSQNDLRVHFGLGDATSIDSLIIKYPSGILEVFTNLAVDVFYCNDENSGSLCTLTALMEPAGSEFNFKMHPNPVADVLTVELNGFENTSVLSVKIFNSLSELIVEQKVPAGQSAFEIKLKKLFPGNYQLSITDGEKKYSTQFIKM